MTEVEDLKNQVNSLKSEVKTLKEHLRAQVHMNELIKTQFAFYVKYSKLPIHDLEKLA